MVLGVKKDPMNHKKACGIMVCYALKEALAGPTIKVTSNGTDDFFTMAHYFFHITKEVTKSFIIESTD